MTQPRYKVPVPDFLLWLGAPISFVRGEEVGDQSRSVKRLVGSITGENGVSTRARPCMNTAQHDLHFHGSAFGTCPGCASYDLPVLVTNEPEQLSSVRHFPITSAIGA